METDATESDAGCKNIELERQGMDETELYKNLGCGRNGDQSDRSDDVGEMPTSPMSPDGNQYYAANECNVYKDGLMEFPDGFVLLNFNQIQLNWSFFIFSFQIWNWIFIRPYEVIVSIRYDPRMFGLWLASVWHRDLKWFGMYI